jgi:hypothetical protein
MHYTRAALIAVAVVVVVWRPTQVQGQPMVDSTPVPIRASLKKAVGVEKDLENQDVDAALLWIHNEIWRKHEVSVAFLYSEEMVKKREYLVAFRTKKDTTYEAVLLEILGQIKGTPVVREGEGLVRIELAEPQPKR